MSQEIQGMFRGIAPRYDLANDVLSFGVHRVWRRSALKFAGIKSGSSVLDLCTGTGDVAANLRQIVGHSGEVIGLDFVYEMLTCACAKYGFDRPNVRGLSFLQGDAMALPFRDGTFDAVTVAFGIRNVDDTAICLNEMRRVLKDGGVALILEFGKPTFPVFSSLYRFYGSRLMPRVGGLLTGDRSAYQYLPETAKNFPDAERFLALMKTANFASLRMKPYLSGVAYAYAGIR